MPKTIKAAGVVILLFIFLAVSVFAAKQQVGKYSIKQINSKPNTLSIQAQKLRPMTYYENSALKSPAEVSQGGEDISSAVAIPSLPAILTGTTAGYQDDYDEQCPNTSASPDVVYSYTPSGGQRIHLISCNSAYWTKLYIYVNDENTLLACNQYSDSCLPDYRAAIYDIQVDPGNIYYFVVDGWGGQLGEYELEVAVRPPVDTLLQYPALGSNNQGLLVLAHQYYEYDSLVYWLSSVNNGMTWSDAVYWNFNNEPASFPSLDYWGDDTVFYGTLVTPHAFYSGSPNYLVEMKNGADPFGFEGSYWNWNTYGWHDMKMVDIACDAGRESWEWGLQTMIHSTTYTDPAMVDGPHIFYPTDPEGYATISWYSELDGCNSTMCDIDRATQKAYTVYDRYNDSLGLWELFGRQDDASDWDEEVFAAGYIYTMDDSTHMQYPAVAAYDGVVLIAAENWAPDNENDKDLICWYTLDGDLANLTSAVVVGTMEAERFPRLQHIIDQTFLCTFIKNNELYAVYTEDAGMNWSEPEPVSVFGDEVVNEYRATDIAEANDYGARIIYEYREGAKLEGNINLRLTHYWVYDLPCGDCNSNALLNMLDITFLLGYLYKGGPAPYPLEAADVDGNGLVNLQDATYMINFLYKGGAALNCP